MTPEGTDGMDPWVLSVPQCGTQMSCSGVAVLPHWATLKTVVILSQLLQVE